MINPVLARDLSHIHAAVTAKERFANAVVLVTGCAGFLGFYLMRYLVRHARDLAIRKVIGLDTFLLGRPKWLDELAQNHDVLEVRAFNIATEQIADVPGADEASYVLHMASIASPTFYRLHPVETIDANVWGLRRLLDFYVGSSRLKGLLFFSSSEVYGDPVAQAIPTDEDYRGNVSSTGPRACYDEAKRFGETLCSIFARSHDMPVTIVRPFNNYGPGMRLDDRRLPADFAKCVVENRDLVILSDGAPTRTFCYVADAVAGYLLALLHGRFDTFNIGIESPEISVRDLAAIYQRSAANLCGYRGRVRFERSVDSDYLTDNPNRRCPVIARARAHLGYAPSISVEDGVPRYLEFLIHEGRRS